MTPQTPAAAPAPKIRILSKPAAGDVVLVAAYDFATETGSVEVETDVDEAQTDRVVAWIQSLPTAFAVPPSIDFTQPIPDGGFELDTVDGTTWSQPDAQITGLPSFPAPTANNRRVFVAGYDVNGDRIGDAEDAPFVAMPPVVQTNVTAHRCLFLTYAEGKPIAAFAETTSANDDYLPLALPLPADVTAVRIQVLGGLWQHDPALATQTGAEGRPGTEQPLDPNFSARYSNATLQSANISSANPPLRLNRLAGLWKYLDPNQATTEFDAVTSDPINVPPGTRPTHLCLGFHDGFEWSNNSGLVTVQIIWLE
jgi:hypothetical protein